MAEAGQRHAEQSQKGTQRAWLLGILMIGLTIIITAAIIQAPEIIGAIDRFTP